MCGTIRIYAIVLLYIIMLGGHILRIDIPRDAELIINTFNENGYEAYVVGGCVRDSLLGRVPEDWDITTSAKPEEIKRLFHKTIDTGIQHGTVTVRMHGQSYEVTTYRIDGEYEDNRHPKNVTYTSELREDLMRRDFTINAMAYSPAQGLIDIFGGIEDLNNKIIRCVGNASERFDEDALRTLRAIRFAGQLGFDIEQGTYDAICSHAGNIANVSAERIRVELTKLIESEGADRIRLISETGLADIFLPELTTMLNTGQNNPHHMYSVGEHVIKVIEGVRHYYTGNDERDYKILCWSALLHDVAKPACKMSGDDGVDHFYGHPKLGMKMAEDILKRLKFDNYTIAMVKRLVWYHDYRFDDSKRNMRRFLSKAGSDIMPLLLVLMRADVYGQSGYRREEKLERLDIAKRNYEAVLEAGAAVTIKDLKVNGNDLMGVGIGRGKVMGDVLKKLLDEVIEDPSLNEHDVLLDRALDIYRNIS